MRAMTKKTRLAAVLAAALLGVSTTAFAKTTRYEGDIVSIDLKAGTFTVRGTERGEALEKAFLVGPRSTIFMDGELRLLGQLGKGDHVVVTYDPANDLPAVAGK